MEVEMNQDRPFNWPNVNSSCSDSGNSVVDASIDTSMSVDASVDNGANRTSISTDLATGCTASDTPMSLPYRLLPVPRIRINLAEPVASPSVSDNPLSSHRNQHTAPSHFLSPPTPKQARELREANRLSQLSPEDLERRAARQRQRLHEDLNRRAARRVELRRRVQASQLHHRTPPAEPRLVMRPLDETAASRPPRRDFRQTMRQLRAWRRGGEFPSTGNALHDYSIQRALNRSYQISQARIAQRQQALSGGTPGSRPSGGALASVEVDPAFQAGDPMEDVENQPEPSGSHDWPMGY